MNGHRHSFKVHGHPEITHISPLVAKVRPISTHIISGYNFSFDTVLRVFLLPDNSDSNLGQAKQYNLMSHYVQETDTEPTLEMKYPPFVGIEVDNFKVLSDNRIELIINNITAPVKIDVIVANRAGYGRASVDLNQSSDKTARFDTVDKFSSDGIIVFE